MKRSLGILEDEPYDDIVLDWVPSEADSEVKVSMQVEYLKSASKESQQGSGDAGLGKGKAKPGAVSGNVLASAGL